MKIWTDDECIEVEPNDVGELEAAMRFKAEHIKAKADPELFTAVADMLDELWDVAIRWADVVRCRECLYWDNITHFCHYHSRYYDGGRDWDRFKDYDFCSYGERKEGAE